MISGPVVYLCQQKRIVLLIEEPVIYVLARGTTQNKVFGVIKIL